jgi:hypothetical protein
VDNEYVSLVEGVIPAAASHSYVGSVLKRFTTVLKNATASAPWGLSLGRQVGFKVLQKGIRLSMGHLHTVSMSYL